MITLSSDFGSPYPAAMKGVLLQRTEDRLVDVAHELPRQDVRAAAFWLEQLLPYFPPAVHLVVVDPGVGTQRDALVIRAGDHAIVAPDNGVAMPVARTLADAASLGDAGPLETYRVTYEVGDRGGPVAGHETDYQPPWPPAPASTTFHGRDVFAPAAAAVHGRDIAAIGEVEGLEPVDDVVDLELPVPSVDEERAVGTVLAVDDFGNAITNVLGDVIADRFGETIDVDGSSAPVERTYAAVEPHQRLVTVGSHGNVELAVNRGRGDEAFGVESGDDVRLDL